MSRRAHDDKQGKVRHHRKALPLPYSTPPAARPLRVDPSLHTAAELMRSSQHSSVA